MSHLQTVFTSSNFFLCLVLLVASTEHRGCRERIEEKIEQRVGQKLVSGSFLYVALTELFVDGDGKLDFQNPYLQPGKLEKLQRGLNSALPVIRTQHNTSLEGLKALFPGHTQWAAPPHNLRVKIFNDKDSYLNIGPDGVIRISSRTFKNIISGTIVGAIKCLEPVMGKCRVPGTFTPEVTDEQVLKSLQEFVEATKHGRMDLLMKLESGAPHEKAVMSMAGSTDSLLSDYHFLLLFMLAHEVGHITLGHVDKNNVSAPSCMLRKEQEREADRYASYIVHSIYFPTARAMEDEKWDGYTVTIPDFTAMFFYLGYPEAGFSKGANLCYPTEAERLEIIAESKRQAYEDAVPYAKRLTDKQVVDFIKKYAWLPERQAFTRANIFKIRPILVLNH